MEAVQHGMVERVEAEHVALLAEQATGVRGENFKEYEVSLRPSRGQADADEEGNKRLDAPSASTIAFRSEIRAVCDIEAQGQPVSCWRVRPEGARYSGEKASNLKSAVFTLPREAIVYNGSSPVEALAALGHNTGFAFVREGWRFWCKQRTVSGGWIRIQIFQARPLRDPLDPTSALDPLQGGMHIVDVTVRSDEDTYEEWDRCDEVIEGVKGFLSEAVDFEKPPNVVAQTLVFDDTLPKMGHMPER